MVYKMFNGFQKWSQAIEGKEVRLRKTRIKLDLQVIYPAFWGKVTCFRVNYSNAQHKCIFDMCFFLIHFDLKIYFKVYFKDDTKQTRSITFLTLLLYLK